MSNSHLFLKSGFPKAPLQNGIGRYIAQLKRVTIKFCKESGASKGMRDFIETELVDFAKANPGVVVYVKPRRHRTPVLVGEYLNGEREWINCRNYSKEEVNKWIDLMRTQNGPSGALRLRKLWHTNVPSIQGPWTPFTMKQPETNLIVFPSEELSKPLFQQQTATEKLIELFQKQKLEGDNLEENRAK